MRPGITVEIAPNRVWQMRTPQVSAAYYSNFRYFSLLRAITHWHQVATVSKFCPPGGTVLEIGPGMGHSTFLLRHFGYEVQTLDIEPDLHPDIVGSVLDLDIDDRRFDCVLAAEVLEHLPFDDFSRAVSELCRVTRRYVVISLPSPFIGVSMLVNIPLLKPLGFSIGLPVMRPHRFDGQHYWELGKSGFAKRRIRDAMRRAGVRIIAEFRPVPSLYTYFFVLERLVS
jgi:ubiquinone/menaquinone biosynthesis C-methylase UbiE